MGVVVNSTPRPLYPRKETRYPLYIRLGGPQGRSGGLRKISPAPGFDPRTVQPVASRYTDWAIPAPAHKSSKVGLECELWLAAKITLERQTTPSTDIACTLYLNTLSGVLLTDEGRAYVFSCRTLVHFVEYRVWRGYCILFTLFSHVCLCALPVTSIWRHTSPKPTRGRQEKE